jgi:hypothetical protein
MDRERERESIEEEKGTSTQKRKDIKRTKFYSYKAID